MKNLYFLLLIASALFVFSCNSSKDITKTPRFSNCKQNFKNNFSRIDFDNTFVNIDNKITEITQAQFYCVYSFLQTKKLMFDTFGKWDVESLPKGEHHPLLIWNNISLLDNLDHKFIVITSGEGVYNEETIASISVLDENGMDALSTESQYRVALMDYFSTQIKQLNHEDEEFYKVYLKKVSPKKYQKLYGNRS